MGCADFYVFGDANNINDEDVAVESASYEIREVFDLKEKRKWMDFFRKSYTGGLPHLIQLCLESTVGFLF